MINRFLLVFFGSGNILERERKTDIKKSLR